MMPTFFVCDLEGHGQPSRTKTIGEGTYGISCSLGDLGQVLEDARYCERPGLEHCRLITSRYLGMVSLALGASTWLEACGDDWPLRLSPDLPLAEGHP